jgi:hypothetical protein
VKADAGPSEPSELTHQQRLEQFEELTDILVSIFGSLTPEQRVNYVSEYTQQEAA